MVDIATDASVKPASHPKPLRVGLDIGSTTVKAVVLDQSDSLGDTLFSDYRRHHANVRATVAGLLVDIHKKLVDLGRGDEPIRLSITGSGGLALADNLHVPFIQEVIAETEAIDKEYPQADVIIELGGEDAKITYLKPTPEQRMNGSCAGGTGAFIDQMSTLLDTDAAGLNEMDKTICAPNGTTMMPPSGNAWEGFQPVDPENVEGEWKLMTTSEETKECIKILADMYAKGGLDNSIGTKDDFAGATDDFVAGKIGAVNYGFSSYGQYDWIVTDKWLNGNPDGSYEDLVLGTPLSGDAGMAVSYNAPYWMGFNWFIPDSCENPERVLDLIEFIATDAGQSLIFDGTEDMFTVDADGNITRDADKWKEVNDIYNVVDGRTQYLWFIYLFAGSQEKLELESATDWYEASMNTIKVDRYPEGPQKEYGTGVLDSYGLDAYGELPAYFTIIPYSDEANEIRTQLADITLRYIPAFIAGQKDIDAEWDAYVAEYEAAGAAQIEQEFNEGIQTAKAAYDSYQK